MPQVRLQVAMKVTACNIKRWARAARRRAAHARLLLLTAILAVLATPQTGNGKTAAATG